MSLEKDIAQVQKIFEKDDVFKPASKAELDARRAARLKELNSKPLIPVDDTAIDLDGKRWTADQKLSKRVGELREKYNVGDKCICNSEVIELHGEENEFCTFAGENGYMDAYCLRCGGAYDAW